MLIEAKDGEVLALVHNYRRPLNMYRRVLGLWTSTSTALGATMALVGEAVLN